MVNNAGYAKVAPVETGNDVDFRTQFETNVWGVYNVSKAVIPRVRAQGGGTVVQFSSSRAAAAVTDCDRQRLRAVVR